MLELEHNFVLDENDFEKINNSLNDLTRGKSVAYKKQEIEEIITFQESYIREKKKKQ